VKLIITCVVNVFIISSVDFITDPDIYVADSIWHYNTSVCGLNHSRLAMRVVCVVVISCHW
jgi:hypothetical protein